MLESEQARRGIVVSAKVAEHVCWFLGDTNLGKYAGPAVDALLRAVRTALADHSDNGVMVLAGFYAQWPEYVAAMRRGDPVRGGDFEWLRGIVKADDQLALDDWAVRS